MFSRLVTILGIAILCLQTTYAQNLRSQVEIKRGKSFKLNKTDNHVYHIPLEDGGFIATEIQPVLLRGSVKYVIKRYNDKLTLLSENELDLKINDEKHDFMKFLYLQGKLFMITSITDNKTKQNKLFSSEIDLRSLKRSSTTNEISSIDFQGNSKRNSGDFFTYSSDDESKVIVFSNLPQEKDEPRRFRVSMLDVNQGLKQLWQKDIQSDEEEDLVSLKNVAISKDGEVAILLRVNDDKKTRRAKKKENRPAYHFDILKVSNKGEKLGTTEIELNKNFIVQIQIAYNGKGELVSSGLYSTDKGDRIDGCYFLALDKENNVKKESQFPFTMDFLTDFMTERQAKKTKKRKSKGKDIGFAEFSLDNLIIKDDGGVIQVAEQYYVTESTYTDQNGVTRTTYTYHFNTILVISITPEGEIEWARKIPKDQSMTNAIGPWISYGLEVIDDKMYFFHVDNAENITAKDNKELKSWKLGKKSVLVMTEINSEGYVNKDIILDAKSEKTVACPNTITKLQDGTFMLFSRWKKKAKYYKLEL